MAVTSTAMTAEGPGPIKTACRANPSAYDGLVTSGSPTLALGLNGGSDIRAAAFVEKMQAATAARLAAAPQQSVIPLARIVLVKRHA